MNTETARPAPAMPPRRLPLLALLGVLLALGALLVGAWTFGELRRIAARVEAQALDVQRAAIRLEAVADELSGVRAQVRELAAAESDLAERLVATRTALDRVLASRDNVDLALAEVEYLFILAEHRLVLMQDADTAAAALVAAQRRLEALDAPGLDAVRGQVEVDLLHLRDLPRPDFRRWHGDLVALAVTAGSLPLRASTIAADVTPAPTPAPTGWRGLVQLVWTELRQFVVVTRTDVGAPVLPGERAMLVQGLQLRIDTARLALLRRDHAALQDAAEAALAWLDRWFDPADAGVRAAGAQLRQLSALDPAPSLPEITSSLETLRALMRERAAPGTPLPADEAAP